MIKTGSEEADERNFLQKFLFRLNNINASPETVDKSDASNPKVYIYTG